MVATTDKGSAKITTGNRSPAEIGTASTGGKYHIYSSKAGKKPGASVHILSPDTSTDRFVSSLKNKVIILKTTPNPAAAFDSSDEWSKWLTKFYPKGKPKFSLRMDDARAKIQSFEFNFTAPWDMVFSSSSDALNFSFGAPAPVGANPARIPAPGLYREDSILVCGLDPSKTGVMKSTVGDLFDYVGLDRTVLHKLAKLSVELVPTEANEKRNALWFNPPFDSQTTVRLQFKLTEAGKLQDVLAFALPGFAIQAADAICKKVLVAAETERGPKGVDTGRVMFEVKCSVTSKDDEPAINMIAGIEFQKSAITLTFQLDSPGVLSGIFRWLEGLIPDSLGAVKGLLEKDGIFKNTNLRRITIVLDTATNDSDKPKLSSFRIDIEVSATFGQGPDSKPALFLATYNWAKGGGKLGFIRGQFWNCKHMPIFAHGAPNTLED